MSSQDKFNHNNLKESNAIDLYTQEVPNDKELVMTDIGIVTPNRIRNELKQVIRAPSFSYMYSDDDNISFTIIMVTKKFMITIIFLRT